MMRPTLLLFALAAIAPAGESTKGYASIEDGEIIPRYSQGEGWSTRIEVVNVESEDRVMFYQFTFLSSAGQPQDINVTSSPSGVSGQMATLSGVVPAAGVDVYELTDDGGLLRAGYALLDPVGLRGVAVNVILTQRVPGRPDFETSFPAQSAQKHMRIAFRNSGPNTTSIALTSTISEFERWFLSAYSSKGIKMCEVRLIFERGHHVAGILSDLLSCTAGRDGMLQITSPSGGGSALGLIFNDFGAFAAQPTYSCCTRLP